MIDMIVKKKYIQLVLFVLLFSLGACNSDEMSDINDTTEVQEQMVLKLSVQQESVVYTRGTGTPADEAKVESMDFLYSIMTEKLFIISILYWNGLEMNIRRQ